jgi:Domain of unknown function (DUF2024)
MKYAVYDTWVDKKEGGKMHFDIIVPESETIEQVILFGKEYLKEKNQPNKSLNPKNCVFCHLELGSETMLKNIEETGYHILEMQGCN